MHIVSYVSIGKKTNTVEFQEWYQSHEDVCSANHKGSSGKMEVDAMVEMFSYSETKYGVKYANYIGDGDSKTYSGIIKSDPYKNTTVNKKECIVLGMSKSGWGVDYVR